MQGVNPGQEKIEAEEQLKVPRIRPVKGPIHPRSKPFQVVVPPLETELDADEGQPKSKRKHQESNQEFPLSQLGGTDAQRHRQAAAQQHGRIGGPDFDVEQPAAGLEGGQIEIPENDIGGEQAAEEHDLRSQEHPHAQARSFVLLLEVVELFRQCGAAMQLKSPPFRTRTLLPSRWAFPRSSRWEAATAFAIPGPWRPRDSAPPPGRNASTKPCKPGGSGSPRPGSTRPADDITFSTWNSGAYTA